MVRAKPMKTSTPRVLKTREKAKELGRKRKEYSLTDDEDAFLKAQLAKYRAV